MLTSKAQRIFCYNVTCVASKKSCSSTEKTLPEMAGTMVPVKGYVVDKIDTMLRVPLAALQARSEEHLKHPDR